MHTRAFYAQHCSDDVIRMLFESETGKVDLHGDRFFSLSQTAEQLESSETLQKGSEVDKSQQFYSAHKANLAIG